MNKIQSRTLVKNVEQVSARYKKPRLSEYGKVSALTQGTTSKTNDPGGSQNGKS